jgi:hypothetical protein
MLARRNNLTHDEQKECVVETPLLCLAKSHETRTLLEAAAVRAQLELEHRSGEKPGEEGLSPTTAALASILFDALSLWERAVAAPTNDE